MSSWDYKEKYKIKDILTKAETFSTTWIKQNGWQIQIQSQMTIVYVVEHLKICCDHLYTLLVNTLDTLFGGVWNTWGTLPFIQCFYHWEKFIAICSLNVTNFE